MVKVVAWQGEQHVWVVLRTTTVPRGIPPITLYVPEEGHSEVL